jgi:hypothetical protein
MLPKYGLMRQFNPLERKMAVNVGRQNFELSKIRIIPFYNSLTSTYCRQCALESKILEPTTTEKSFV